jgi:predicted AAA+ superfamily ATPase
MNIKTIREVIEDQEIERNKILREERIVPRELKIDERYLAHPNILAVLGIRRAGKSVFSWLLLEGRKFAYINFDDERLYKIGAEDLNVILKTFYELYGSDLEYVILDEVQNVEGWELFANRLKRSKKVIITGSNSRLLSGELSTHLTGRYVDVTLFPFSFREYLNYRGVKTEGRYEYATEVVAGMERCLLDYIELGGLPEAYRFGRRFLEVVYRDILTKDIIKRHRIRAIAELENMAKYLMSNYSNEFTFSRLRKVTGIKRVETVRNFFNYLKDAYLFLMIERFSPKLKEQILAPKKVYCLDTGIVNSISLRVRGDFGRLMENMVAIELFRRRSYWYNNWEVFYWKDHGGNEVDFVVREGATVKELIQVSYLSGRDEVEKKKVRALVSASKELRCKNLIFITWDYEDEVEVDGLKLLFRPLWKWLLDIRG